MLQLFLLVAGVALLFARLVNNYLALRHIPGPFLASITDFWRFYHQNQSYGLRTKLLSLHAAHGPVVRYGVRSVSIASASAIPQIYGSRAGFTTADSYKVLVGISNGKEVPSLVSTADEGKHGALRRSIATTFTPAGVAPLEGRIDTSVHELHASLLRLASQSPRIDLALWMLLFSMDSAARQSFSQSRGYLSSGHDVDGTIQLIRNRFYHWGRWSSLPFLERVIYRNPYSMRRKQAPSAMVNEAISQLQIRLTQTGEKTESDLLQALITASSNHPDLLDKQGIVGLLMSTISGAGDTTATALTATIYYLTTNPSTLSALRTELSRQDVAVVPTNSTVSQLPYLHAVIREAMRLFSSATWPIERKVPQGGLHIPETNITIPEGTSVGVLPAAVHLDTTIFGSDVRSFRPERWTDASDEQLRRMEAAHMGFSRGRRVCLGQNIAMMQMKKVVAMFVQTFDVEILEKEKGLQADFSPAVPCVKPWWVRLARREQSQLVFEKSN